MQELIIGSISVSVLITIILRIIYSVVDVNNKIKPIIAIVIGIAFGIIALQYNSNSDIITFREYVDYIIQGFMTGATAVGLYEITQVKKS